jgi:predicted RNase H-like nuclease (RuvC/YqgF family)
MEKKGEPEMTIGEKAKTWAEWKKVLFPVVSSDSEGDFTVGSQPDVLLVEASVAQQEIDKHGKNNEALAKVCSDLNDKIERLERERGSQKQKLQKLIAKFPQDLRTDPKTDTLCLVPLVEFHAFHNQTMRLKKEFEELLK